MFNLNKKTISKKVRGKTYGRSDSGYTLPIAIGLGSIIVLIGFTLVLRSSRDRTTVTSQQQTANSLAVAEGGIARTLALLNDNYQPFLKLNYDPINPATSRTYLGPNGIFNTGDEELTAPIPNWTNPSEPPPCFDATTISTDLLVNSIGIPPNDGDYEVLAYRYDSLQNTGTLLVRGKDPQDRGTSVVQQILSVTDTVSSNPANFPGLLAEDINLGNNDILGAIAGNVVCTDSSNCSIPSAGCIGGEPTTLALRTAINAGPSGQVQGRIFIRSVANPTLPLAPSVGAPDTMDRGDITSNTTLTPPAGTTPYSYLIGDISLSGSDSLTVDTSARPVHLFVRGDITLSGNATINHSGEPQDLRIYGNPENTDPTNDQTFELNGGASASNFFLYAPDANAGINGGSSNPDIYGAVWVKTWGNVGSASNNVEILVPDDMPQRLGGGFSSFIVGTRTSTSERWERVQDPSL